MANRFLRTGTIDRKTYSDQLSKTFDVMWLRSKKEVTALQPFFDKTNVNEGDTYVIGNVGSALTMPVVNEDTDKKPFAQPAPGSSKTITLYPYRLFVRVTDNMMRMQRYGRVEGMVSGLPQAAMAKLEYLRAAIFNGAFSGTDGADSLALCYDSHPHENSEFGTWDNLGTGAMTVGNLHALLTLGLNMTNEFGRPYPVNLKRLLIPTALKRTAEENKVAAYDPETALNTPQVLINALTYTVSPHLTDSDAYFAFGDLQGEEKGIHEVSLMDPSVADDEPANVDIVLQKRVKFIVGFGFSTSKNVYGSAGA